MAQKRSRTQRTSAQRGLPNEAADLKIIGGQFRGRRLCYAPFLESGDASPGKVTRPMKHRVREAIFNLVGPSVKEMHALDLFAGTGALGLEALSRGALGATFIERHVPTAEIVRENIATLGVEDRSTVCTTSAFLWSKRDLPNHSVPTTPWIVFVSPPYSFFKERREEMIDLIRLIEDRAPSKSVLVVEADERFDFEALPGAIKPSRRHTEGWDVRAYPPAVVGMWRKS